MNIDLNLINNDNLAPRDEVRIEHVAATPSPDGRRVKVEIELTPFRERPNMEIEIVAAPDNNEDNTAKRVANASVLATMTFKMAFNLHLRGIQNPAGNYQVNVVLYYDDLAAPQDTESISIAIAPGATSAGDDLT